MSATVSIPGFSVGDLFLTGNPILVEVEGSGCPQGCTDYRLLLKVEADNQLHLGAGEWTDQIIPGSDNKAVFDIHGYVDLPVPCDFHFPPTYPVHGYYDRSTAFTVTPGESWIDANGDLQETWDSDLGDFFAIRGGVSDSQLAAWIGASTNFNTVFAGIKPLTWRANPSTVLPNQPVKLWMAWKHGESLAATLSITYFYDDNTFDVKTTNFDVYTDAVYEFDLQPALHGINPDNGVKRLVSYEATIINGGNQVYEFIIDWNYYERPFFLLYQNGLGSVDDVALTGGWQTGYRSQSTTAWQPLPTDATQRTSTVKVTGKTGSRFWKVNTGFKPAAEMGALAGDLLMCRNAWLLVPTMDPSSLSDYTVVPVTIADGDITATSWDNDLCNIEITFTEAHDNKYF